MEHSGGAKPTLVIIDDQQELCDLVVAIARSAGYDASAVIDAGPWLESAAPAPDVIILDLMMPGVDGIEVLRKLAARHQTSRIIISSAHSASVLDASMRLAGALGLRIAGQLPKPVQAARLRELLGRQLAAPAAPPDAKPQVTLDELHLALEHNQFVVHFQPQVALADGRYEGVEALVRWQHPQYGLLSPDRFIALAETNGLALPLTRCVLGKALPEAVAQQRAGLKGSVSFNLPPVALTDVRFPEEVVRLQDQYQARGVELLFELTETSLATDSTAMLDILTRLRLKGFALSIDDFGTGHSSLTMLHQMPFTELKIDLNFVRTAETDATARVIVEKSIALGRGLGLKVLAEGVENEALWHWLRNAGCDTAQGYYISRPLPSNELLAWSHGWRAPLARVSA